jgi:hypothetical protein
MRLILSILAILSAASVQGQDLAARSNAMQSLKESLSRQKPVNWLQTPTSPEASAYSTHVTATISDVTVDNKACKVSFKDGRLFPDQRFESVQTWQLNIPDIDRVTVESLEGFIERLRSEGGRPSWATKTVPTVFVLEIVAAPNHKFDVHRWSKNNVNEVSERDVKEPLVFIVFGGEADAREAGKMVQNATVRCATTRQH